MITLQDFIVLAIIVTEKHTLVFYIADYTSQTPSKYFTGKMSIVQDP